MQSRAVGDRNNNFMRIALSRPPSPPPSIPGKRLGALSLPLSSLGALSINIGIHSTRSTVGRLGWEGGRMPMVGAAAAAAGAPRGTVCAAAVQDPYRSFIATAAATAPAFRPPGLGRPPPSSVRPSVRPSSQVWPDPAWTLEEEEHSPASASHMGRI